MPTPPHCPSEGMRTRTHPRTHAPTHPRTHSDSRSLPLSLSLVCPPRRMATALSTISTTRHSQCSRAAARCRPHPACCTIPTAKNPAPARTRRRNGVEQGTAARRHRQPRVVPAAHTETRILPSGSSTTYGCCLPSRSPVRLGQSAVQVFACLDGRGARGDVLEVNQSLPYKTPKGGVKTLSAPLNEHRGANGPSFARKSASPGCPPRGWRQAAGVRPWMLRPTWPDR